MAEKKGFKKTEEEKAAPAAAPAKGAAPAAKPAAGAAPPVAAPAGAAPAEAVGAVLVKEKRDRGPKLTKAEMKKKRRAHLGAEVRRKEFTYRGYTLEELKAMPLDNLTEILPSRARRTIRRGFTEEQEHFIERLARYRAEKPLRTHGRDIIILPSFVGHHVGIHNGKAFVDVQILPEMIGHYLGEFARTCGDVHHTGPGVGATKGSKFMPLK